MSNRFHYHRLRLSKQALIAIFVGIILVSRSGSLNVMEVEAASFVTPQQHMPITKSGPHISGLAKTVSRRKKSSKGVFVHQSWDEDECPLPEDMDVSFPHPDLNAEQVAKICMDALHCRPPQQSLEICFNYSSDRCRAAVGGSLQEFIQYASNPVFGTMVNCDGYDIVSVGPIIPGSMHRGAMQTVLVDVQKPLTVEDIVKSAHLQQQPPNAAQASQQATRRRPSAMERREQRLKAEAGEAGKQATGNDGVDDGRRRFLWTLQQERRPPRQNCWLVHEVLFIKNAFALTL